MHNAQCTMLKAQCSMLNGAESTALARGRRSRRGLSIVHCALCISFCIASCVALSAQSPPLPSIDVVLPRMFAYLEQFLRDFGGMVAEEAYVPSLRPSGWAPGDTPPQLRSA